MGHWKKLYVSENDAIKLVIERLDSTVAQICLVVDENQTLLGTVTDGDIRRGILRSLPLTAPISMVMKPTPIVGFLDQAHETWMQLMLSKHVRHLPIVNDQGRVVGLSLLDELLHKKESHKRQNPVVLMAGGFGSRLSPLTNDTPKPLLQVGSKPILERILESLISFDFQTFYISVNYKAEMLRDYFGDGSNWGVTINYLSETAPMGTAGALSELRGDFAIPILVVNGDVLTGVNFSNLIDFHVEQGEQATMCVRNYEFQVPYGVVHTESTNIVSIDEKPLHNFFVNAGIYVLEAETLSLIPKCKFFNMTDLFESLIQRRIPATVFPIREYWVDIGRMDDFTRANNDFQNVK